MAAPLRISIIGSSGSGKTTCGRRLQAATGIPFTDLDEINWRPGWVNRSVAEPDRLLTDVSALASRENWIIAGNYSVVQSAVLSRATHLLWLDLPRWRVMAQLVPRCCARA